MNQATIPKDVENLPEGREIPEVPLAEYVNYTPFPTQYYQAVDQHGEVFHVVAMRVTYNMELIDPKTGIMQFAKEQTPLCTEDVWMGEPNQSPPLWESDLAPYKPKCDVLVVNAVSTPPESDMDYLMSKEALSEAQTKKSKRWLCSVSLENPGENSKDAWKKEIVCTGPRKFGVFGLSNPELTDKVEIHYGNAYGGECKKPESDIFDSDGKLKKAAGAESWETNMLNPVGVGFPHGYSKTGRGPQLEIKNNTYKSPFVQNNYPPVALTCIGRGWSPRLKKAGTYDDKWLKTQWPLPPMDHDYAYWQSAPEDQQIPYPKPRAKISLVNLYPGKNTWQGKFPKHTFFLLAVYLNKEYMPMLSPEDLELDTIVVNPKAKEIYATYRCLIAASNNILKIEARMAQFHGDQPVPKDKYQLKYKNDKGN